MATQASKASAMAGSASRFIEIQLTRCMSVKKIWSMIRWPQIHVVSVTLCATEGRVHFVVAHQTVFHVWKIRLRQRPLNLCDAAMAGTTSIIGDQVGPQLQDVYFVRRAKILLAVDRTRNHWSKVAEAKVKRVIEVFQNLAPMFLGKTS